MSAALVLMITDGQDTQKRTEDLQQAVYAIGPAWRRPEDQDPLPLSLPAAPGWLIVGTSAGSYRLAALSDNPTVTRTCRGWDLPTDSGSCLLVMSSAT